MRTVLSYLDVNKKEIHTMSRTITVKGIGRASAKPDTVVISMSLDSRAMDYDKAMEIAIDNLQDITSTLTDAGFGKEDVKTTNYTCYSLAEECLAAPTMARSIDIEPEDIDVSDTATFVWEID